jgi:hypothetical protein
MAHFFHLFFVAFLWFVTAIFMVGITGTAVVLIITGWEDIKVITGREETPPKKRLQSSFETSPSN